VNVRPELEICAETLQACIAAHEGGADRIELCSALSEGGLTPSHGLIQTVVAKSRLPVHVLLRPRGGNFIYADAEFAIIQADLLHALEVGATGVVVGILTPKGTLDKDRMQTLIQLATGRPVTFHRAFDRTQNLSAALEDAITVGCTRILTSGGKPTAPEGAGQLARLIAQAAGRIRIAAGGGVTPATAPALRTIARLDLHASLRGPLSSMMDRSKDPLWQQQGTQEISSSDVKALADILRAS